MMLASKTLDRLDKMLDEGINGTFIETDYNESKMSKLESKWKRYLADSVNSRNNIEREKESIKSLISDISHQTKTPMTNIRMYTELIREHLEVGDADGAAKLTTYLMAQVDKMDFLIQALTQMSRLETDVITVKPYANLLQPMLREIIAAMKVKADAKDIRIICADTEETATFDPRWTREAVGNVLDNAVKYSPDRSDIHIEVTARELFTEIRISDQGPGIPEDEQAQIFQRFYRGRDNNSDEGVGIGLYLTRQILQKEGGYIKASSTPGGGSVFSIFLKR